MSAAFDSPALDGAVDGSARVPEVSVVIPCLNEVATLGTCIQKAQAAFAEASIFGEIVVADNGSTDGSQDLARDLGARVVDVVERGYGSALAGGIAAARAPYVVMGDADDSYDFLQLGDFVGKLREGFDLVIGNRFSGGIAPGAMPFLHKYLGNPALTLITRRFFRVPVGDVYCGLRGFRRGIIGELALMSNGMEYAIEMVVKARLAKLKIAEVPTTLSPDGRDRSPHLKTWRDGWRSLRFLLLYSPNWLFLYPGVALVAVGLLTMAWLTPGQRSLGSLTFDVHTLLFSSLAVILGFQAIIFAVCANQYAREAGLLPEDHRLVRMLRRVTLELGLVVGFVLIVTGLALSIYAVLIWQRKSFGRLDYAKTLRIVIPASTTIAVGSQLMFASFFLSILRLRRR